MLFMYDGNLEKDIVTFYVNNMGKRRGNRRDDYGGRSGSRPWNAVMVNEVTSLSLSFIVHASI